MDVTQISFAIFAVLIAVIQGLVYWFDSSLRGIYIGWLLAALAGVTLSELFVGLAGMIA